VRSPFVRLPFESRAGFDETVEHTHQLLDLQPPRQFVVRVSIGSSFQTDVRCDVFWRPLPSGEVTGYSPQVARGVETPVSCDARYGFERDDAPDLDDPLHLKMLNDW